MHGRGLITVLLLWPRPVFRGCGGGQTISVTARVVHLLSCCDIFIILTSALLENLKVMQYLHNVKVIGRAVKITELINL